MTKWNLLILLLLFCVFVELILGTFGLIFPVTAFLVFYVTINSGWRLAVVIAFCGGLAIDLLFLRPFIVTPFSLAAVSFLALFWLYRVESEDLLLHMVPGIIIPVIYLLPLVLIQQYEFGIDFLELLRNSANLVFCLFTGAVALPLFIVGVDYIGEVLELDLYADAKSKLAERETL